MTERNDKNKPQVQRSQTVADFYRRRGLSPKEIRLRRLRFGVWPLCLLALTAMIFLSFSRILLTAWQWDQVPEGSLSTILLQGIRIDFASICALFGVPFLLLSLVSLIPSKKLLRYTIVLLKFISAVAIAFLVLNEAATVEFVEEYGVRPNHIFVQYLMYPQEIFLTLWGGHKLEFVFIFVSTIGSFIGTWFFASWLFKRYRKGGWLYNLVALLLILCIVPLGIRSTLGHRPLNPSMVAFSSNAMANSLPLNSSYSVVYALTHLNDSTIAFDDIYQLAYDKEVINGALALSAHTPAARFNDRCPFNQQVLPVIGMYDGTIGSQEMKRENGVDHMPYNVVIIIEESLGDNFVASQGGFPVTPYLENLRNEGWWFNNMYATGHRSIRGIEAITASFPPSPLSSIVKLPEPMRPYATIFNVLGKAGYKTSFIYGGESHFDNMRNYFLHNGMQEVIDESDYENPMFAGSWGVSDEDLFNRAHEEFTKHYNEGEPFCAVLFSSSFHDPFDIPEGKVSLDFETKEPARLLAAKYADYAVGKYMEKAKAADTYYNNTVFLIIADHESRVRGTGVFPLHDFTIPAVIIAPNVKPHVDDRQLSQIDMSMTLLSLAGIEGEVPNVGQDMTRSDTKDRAFMQFNNMFGYLQKDRFLSLTPGVKPYMYSVVDGEKVTSLPEVDDKMLEEAIELSNLGSLIYRYEYMSHTCISVKGQNASAVVKK